ncbi:hypothetical protein ABB29_02810 [Pseudoxanthomonas dokdonensis]|uniref:Lysozyme inhibitor LprI-like N-terminal domain-containing protein n=1 Tax=Pseudoxanthomonas dokdonensis TaxID=344882 RepID=A0A0R0CP53_9GAMM|nr:hypothetical protein ABB29_02810 [Pseudoxanthomonas dokdonensis]
MLPSTTVYSNDYNACLQAEDGTQDAIIQCQQAETKSQDARLNSAYKALIEKLPGEKQHQLRDTQRLWIKYRDAKCDFVPVYRGDQPDNSKAVADCLLQMTAERAQALELLLQVLP